MEVTIERADDVTEIFEPYYEMLASYIENVVCVENEHACLLGNQKDFELLNEITLHLINEEFPEDIREHMIRGLGVAFSRILESSLDLEWCRVLDGPFSGFAMRKAEQQKVIYPIEILK